MKEFDSLLKSLTKRSFHSLLHFVFSLQIEALSHFGLRAKSQLLSQICTKPPDWNHSAQICTLFSSFLTCFVFPNPPVLGPLAPLGTAPPLHEDTLLCKSFPSLPHLWGCPASSLSLLSSGLACCLKVAAPGIVLPASHRSAFSLVTHFLTHGVCLHPGPPER